MWYELTNEQGAWIDRFIIGLGAMVCDARGRGANNAREVIL